MAFSALTQLVWLALFGFSLAQESNATITTVTDTSTLAIVILPSATNSSSNTSLATNTFAQTSTAPYPSVITLPTMPYTGQSILVGTCDIPQYTMIYLADNGQLEVPLVGCSDDRPDCCPNVPGVNNYTVKPAVNPITSSGAVLPTGVISLYSVHPLTVCPKDFTDIDPICCPSGFSLFPQALAGNQTPCYSHLTTTISVPPNVLASISSYVASTAIASAQAQTTTTASTAVVQVIVNTVYALGLPCGDDNGDNGGEQNGLSVAAKAGIGVGVGVGGLILIAMAWWGFTLARKRRRKQERNNNANNAEQGGQFHNAPDMTMSGYGANVPKSGWGHVGQGAYSDNVLRNSQMKDNIAAPTDRHGHSSIISGPTAAVSGPNSKPGSPPLHYPSSQSHGYSQTPSEAAYGSGDYAQGYMHGILSARMLQNQQGPQIGQMGHPSPGPPGYDTPVGSSHDWTKRSGPLGELEGDDARREVEG